MVEIEAKTLQIVYFPKTVKSSGPYTLLIHSELSQKDFFFDNVQDLGRLNDYYKFEIDFSNVDDGEFSYTISSNGYAYDTGLIRIGVVGPGARGYDTAVEIIQYDQYASPQIRYQHKYVSATTNGDYNITPDAGYVALSEVDVHVDVPSQTINNKSLNKIFANDNVDIINRTELGQKKWYAFHATERPELPSGYTGFYPVTLTVGVDITSVYDSGYTDGVEAASGGSYQQGYDDGEAAQKAKLVATAVTSNGTYSRPDGYASIQVSVPQTGHTDEEMQQAYASGQTYQKSLLVSTAVTSNGTYSRSNGYSSFVVNVAQTGHTDQELLEAFNSGYTNGKNAGYQSGYTAGYASGYTDGWNDCSGQTPTAATAITLTLPSSITGSGQANVIVHPVNAPVNITYTSSDPTIATISNNGTINVLSAGTVTITATDSISQLTDSEVITVAPYSGLNIPFTIEVISAGTILWVADASATPLTIQYQKNNGEWTSITSSTAGTQISVVEGDVVKFRGNNLTYSPNNTSADNIPKYNNHFLMQTGKYTVKGNIMSLIDSTDFANLTTLSSACTFYGLFKTSLGLVDASQLLLPATNLSYYCYQNMFADCTYLEAAPAILPATTLSAACYYNMFSGCWRALTRVPELPATTLAPECYRGMFAGCKQLTAAPTLPATSLAGAYDCYTNMFSNCTALSTPPALPATTLARRCYAGMFESCASLQQLPELPATALTEWCYGGMFDYCTNIQTVPSNYLPATILAKNCYSYMFSTCTNLTSAPDLPATTLEEGCYSFMFRGCGKLQNAPVLAAPIVAISAYEEMFASATILRYIKCLAVDISASNATKNWVKNVQTSSGTFIKDPNMSSWPVGSQSANGIPNNWTVLDAQ